MITLSFVAYLVVWLTLIATAAKITSARNVILDVTWTSTDYVCLVSVYALNAVVPLYAQNADQKIHNLTPEKNANALLGINLII